MYKLLIVDDEAIERDALKFIIDKNNLTFEDIKEAANGQEAISTAAVFEPHIIMMDIKMPGLDGIKASKIIKKILPDAKIIFLTAFDEFDYAHEAIKLGVEDFVIKPATNERLLEAIQNAMDSLKEAEKQKEMKEEIETKLTQVSKYLENEFVTSIINGDIEEDQAKEYLQFMQIQFEAGYAIVIAIHFNEDLIRSNLQRQIVKKRFAKRMNNALKKLQKDFFISLGKDMIYILMMGEDRVTLLDKQQAIRQQIVDLSDQWAREESLYTDFGIGDVYTKLTELWKSFSSAKMACNKKLGETTEYKQHNRINHLIRAISDDNQTAYKQMINEIYDGLLQEEPSIETFKIKLYEFIILFNQALVDATNLKTEETTGIFTRIMRVNNHCEGKLFLKEYTHGCMESLKKCKTDKTSIIIDKMITYINSHYSENITLEQLAEMCGFSTFYLSKLFKKHLNMNFTDYLSYIRIRVAKRLLKNPNNSVKEISYQIGYMDPNYFARVFKKYEGMAPTEYRNKNLDIGE